jgi:type II secretory pathway pseudopilin PulG
MIFKIMKKGAMFGLDARIALAIFGALSVISGAALYSAIQSANAERWRQFFENVKKSTEAYSLDTYKKIPIYSAANLQLDARQLASNNIGINNWNGPYLNGQHMLTGGINGLIETNRYKKGLGFAGEVRMFLRTGSNWSKNDDLSTDGHCIINNIDCFEYVSLYETHGLSQRSYKDMYQIFTALDNLIDNNDGELAGKVRYMDITSAHGIFYKSNPRVYRG